MRKRLLLLVAAGGTGLACAAAFVLLPPPQAVTLEPKLACPALAPRIASADRIELRHAGQVLWLERRGTVWGLALQGGYPVQPGRAEALTGALTRLRLTSPAPGGPDTQGLGDPFQPGPDSGTFVRVLGLSGATLCALVTGPGQVARRASEAVVWHVDPPLAVSADPQDWRQHALPPIEPASIQAVEDDGGLGPQVVEQLVAALPIADTRPRPLLHPTPGRTVRLALTTGTAILTVGVDAGQTWLVVSGTSPWASRLAPYAFALPADSPLAGS